MSCKRISLRLLAALVMVLLMSLSSCTRDEPSNRTGDLAGPTPVAPGTTYYGTTYYVANQAEFEYAMSHVTVGDTVIITVSQTYLMTRSSFYGWRLEATTHATLDCRNELHQHYENMSLENITLWWPYGGGDVTLKNCDATNLFTMHHYCNACVPVVCQGAVSITDCVIRLNVQAGATVDVYGQTFFDGATGRCDDGYTTVDPAGVLRVHEWLYGTMWGGYDPLIESSLVWAFAECDWAYIRLEVADPRADLGTIYYGDNDCNEYQTSTTVINGYHYAEIPMNIVSDGDFWWKARVGYCSDKDWGAEITSCRRVRPSIYNEECPEPWWWPF